jgi:hypothetical protein
MSKPSRRPAAQVRVIPCNGRFEVHVNGDFEAVFDNRNDAVCFADSLRK